VVAGALFARAAAAGAIAAATASMVQSNAPAAAILARHGATACTDVTGFGLLGHLLEMASASNARVSLQLDAIPAMLGVAGVLQQKIFSSLQPANLRLRRALANEAHALKHPNYPLLFDPQTAGGLLAAVPAAAADDAVAELRASGYGGAVVIGTVEEVLSAEDACPAALIECV
jgi:selenide,water dikinase